MKRLISLAALAAVLGLAGCAGTAEYPITRAKAGPTDPVLQMQAPLLPEGLALG